MSKNTTLRQPFGSFTAVVYLLILSLATSPQNVHASTPLFELSRSETLYTVMKAEMALQNGLNQVALDNYLKAAYMTKDPSVAQEATLLAITLESSDIATKASKRWAELDPSNSEAQLIAMTFTIAQTPDLAQTYLETAINQDPEKIANSLVELQSMLTEKAADNLKSIVLTIADNDPKNAYKQLIAALSCIADGDLVKAESLVNQSLANKPNLTLANQLKAQLIRHHADEDEPALLYLKQTLTQFPTDAELRFFYANALFDNAQIPAAIDELKKLQSNPIYGGFSQVLLAEVAIENGELKQASTYLQSALTYDNAKDGALFLLGEIDERQNKPNDALYWYTQIKQGPYYMASILQATAIYKNQKSYDRALELLDESEPSSFDEQKQVLLTKMEILNSAKRTEESLELVNQVLEKIPEDQEMLTMRAMIQIKLKRLELAEKDLHTVLVENAYNANALNVMGYLLSLNKDRLQEALYYSAQALAIAPNNPAFMDSMGWTYYRLGDLKKAGMLLKQANELAQDSQIAAHWGEVLWMSNNQKEAVTVWEKALKYNDDNEELLETLKRFKVDVSLQTK